MSHRRKWKLPGGIRDSKLASFNRSVLPWVGVLDWTMNPTFTLEGITKSTAKAIAAREKSSDSTAKVVDADKMALDHCLSEQGAACAVATASAAPAGTRLRRGDSTMKDH